MFVSNAYYFQQKKKKNSKRLFQPIIVAKNLKSLEDSREH